MRQVHIVPVVVAIAIAAVGAGLLLSFNQENPDSQPRQNTGLKTYYNADLGFQFQYPDTLDLQEDFKRNFWQTDGRHFLELNIKSPQLNGQIFVNDAGRGFEGGQTVSTSQITVAGIPASLITQEIILGEPAGADERILVKFDTNLNYYFFIFRYKKTDSDPAQIVRNLLSSITFDSQNRL